MQPRRTREKAAIPERRKLQGRYERVLKKYEATARRVSQRLQRLITKKGIKATVKYRVKSFESYFAKILRLRKDHKSRALLTDMIGFRITCRYLAALEEVEQVIRAHFQVLDVERKGTEHSFREFGYDSTHMMIDLTEELPRGMIPHAKRVAEIQLRTILQDAWAEVEHEIIYKSDDSLLNEPIKRKLASLNAILKLSDVIFQEVRDYQKGLQQWDVRRRTSLEDKMLSSDPISIVETVEGPQQQEFDSEQSPPMQHGSEIDRLVFEALAAHGSNELEKAIQIYSRVLRMNIPRQVRSVIYNHRGMARFALSEYRRSVEDFARAICHNEDNFRAYNNRALAYRMLHQYERALPDLDQSLAINGVQPEGHYIRALTHFDLQDYAKALADCEMVLNLKPDFSAVHHLKAVIVSRIAR